MTEVSPLSHSEDQSLPVLALFMFRLCCVWETQHDVWQLPTRAACVCVYNMTHQRRLLIMLFFYYGNWGSLCKIIVSPRQEGMLIPFDVSWHALQYLQSNAVFTELFWPQQCFAIWTHQQLVPKPRDSTTTAKALQNERFVFSSLEAY